MYGVLCSGLPLTSVWCVVILGPFGKGHGGVVVGICGSV